jgi:uncharacterized protein YegP (UPF0339 family)
MRRPKLEIYRDGRSEWRWRLRAANGRIVADSGEGYRRRATARCAAGRVCAILAGDALAVEVQSCSAS